MPAWSGWPRAKNPESCWLGRTVSEPARAELTSPPATELAPNRSRASSSDSPGAFATEHPSSQNHADQYWRGAAAAG